MPVHFRVPEIETTMESNNPQLDDELRDDAAPDAEPTPADAPEADASELRAEPEAPQAASEALAAAETPVSAEDSAADLPPAEPEAEAALPAEPELLAEGASVMLLAAPQAESELPSELAPTGAVEPVGEDVTDRPEGVAPAAEESAEEGEAGGPPFKRGDIISGTVLDTSPTEVLVDLGDGLVGVVASRELERMDKAALEGLQKGAEVTVFVLKLKGGDGRPVLSLARAEEESNWRLAEEHYQNKKVYFSKVAGYNKGGLIVRFGKVRGFVPASQVSRERQRRAAGENPEERWGVMVGEDIAVKVVEIDRARNRLILSERAAAREWRERQKSHLLEDLQVGDVRRGRVISVADFGAFVDLGGADGLVHLTELSWQHVTHPRDVVQVGQEVEVEVIKIDPERKRIGLSMKRQASDPWMDIVRGYHIGQLVRATITKLTKFGAFAQLVESPEIEGLIHISELADYRVTHPREVVLVGDVLTLRIVKIEPEQRRLGLSLRQVDSAKFMDQDSEALAQQLDYAFGETEEEAPAALASDNEASAPAEATEAPTAATESEFEASAPADTGVIPTVPDLDYPPADELSGDAPDEPADAEDRAAE